MIDDTDTPTVQMLWDIEQIKQLKARYFRFLDTKDWVRFADLFTDDCEHILPTSEPTPAQNNEEYLANLQRTLGQGFSAHHGHTPEITLVGPDEATGIWAMFDYLDIHRESGGPLLLQGYGHYHETYRRCADGQWRISSKRNVRLRVDTPRPPTSVRNDA